MFWFYFGFRRRFPERTASAPHLRVPALRGVFAGGRGAFVPHKIRGHRPEWKQATGRLPRRGEKADAMREITTGSQEGLLGKGRATRKSPMWTAGKALFQGAPHGGVGKLTETSISKDHVVYLKMRRKANLGASRKHKITLLHKRQNYRQKDDHHQPQGSRGQLRVSRSRSRRDQSAGSRGERSAPGEWSRKISGTPAGMLAGGFYRHTRRNSSSSGSCMPM